MKRAGVLAGFVLSAGISTGCGGTDGTITNTDSGVDTGDMTDTGVMMMPDAGMDDAPMEAGPYGQPSTTYPAFMPWMGQLTKNGGPMLTSPIVVTVTWDGDPSRGTFEGLGDGLGMSTYWPAAVGEYGIGAVTSGAPNHAHISTAAPATLNDQGIRAFITANVGAALPSPTSQTVYVIYPSKSTTLYYGNSPACQVGVGGYHSSYNLNNMQVAYAALARCGGDSQTTAAASHEIGEAATDPHPNSGLYGFDDPYLAFEEWQRSNVENGDACEFFQDSFYTEAQPFAYTVQKLWSNKQGPLGHSPCQPYTQTYYNVAPLDLQDITVDFGGQGGIIKTKGYLAKQGDSIKIPIGIYSDAATGPISITVAESNPLVNPVSGRLKLSVDPMKTSGVNGEKTFIDVTVTMEGPQKLEMLTVITTLNGNKHYYPILVASQ
jgi:hypothetical protein